MKKSLIVTVIVLLGLLIASPIWAATLTLTWDDNSDNEEGFKIERRLGTTGPFTNIGQVGENVTTFTGVTPDNQLYCYRVVAFNQAGEVPSSGIGCGQPLPQAAGNVIVIIITTPVTP